VTGEIQLSSLFTIQYKSYVIQSENLISHAPEDGILSNIQAGLLRRLCRRDTAAFP
jgi:hypothetical protein